jgi:hypothetical protein
MKNSQSLARIAKAAKSSGYYLKDSIRDMLDLQNQYQLSDELFWEVFNNRVLLNRPINVQTYVHGSIPTGHA